MGRFDCVADGSKLEDSGKSIVVSPSESHISELKHRLETIIPKEESNDFTTKSDSKEGSPRPVIFEMKVPTSPKVECLRSPQKNKPKAASTNVTEVDDFLFEEESSRPVVFE